MTKPANAALVLVSVMAIAIGVYESAQARVLLNSNVSVGGIYTDNLFFSETNRVDSYGITVGPSFNLSYTSPDVILGLGYGGVGQVFPDETGANRYIQSASTYLDLPFLTKRIKGLEVRLIENVTFTPSLDGFGEVDQTGATLSNPGVGAAGSSALGGTGLGGTGTGGVGGNISGVAGVGNQGLQIQRTNVFRNLAGFQLSYIATRRLSFNGSYRNLITIFTEDGFRNSNINTITGGATYAFYVTPTTTGNLNYQFTPIISDISNPIIRHRIGVGGSHLFTPTLSINGSVGAAIIQTEATQAFASLSLNKFFEGGGATLRYSQGTGLAQGFANSATLNQLVALTVSHGLGEFLTGFVQLNGARNNSLSGNDIDVLAYGGGAGLTMRILEWLSGGITYNYFKQDNQGGTFGVDADRNFVSVFLTGFADPIKLAE